MKEIEDITFQIKDEFLKSKEEINSAIELHEQYKYDKIYKDRLFHQMNKKL